MGRGQIFENKVLNSTYSENIPLEQGFSSGEDEVRMAYHKL